MLVSLTGALESGLLYALMALGVFITFRILDFPDLTVDGSFTTGGAIAAVMTISGVSPWIALLCAFLGGALAGLCTGLLHTKGKINGLLSGIIMMIALYSINLRILGKPNVSLRNADNIFNGIDPIIAGLLFAIIIKVGLDWFFKTDLGMSLRGTGDNNRMIRSFGANTDRTTIIGVSLSNALVAGSGALIAFSSNAANATMGVGIIVAGLASVIIGEAIFGAKTIFRATMAIVLGAIIYRLIYAIALRVGWLDASDMKLITSIIIIGALIIPTARKAMKSKAVAKRRTEEVMNSIHGINGGDR
ncbi:ABC transporter permease [Paenibacillus sp. MY03]|jgi:putative ABC transport system permease protein|uniref:ABC transporter permease n=1 Tax=Paenibacillus sp. MY03 TaxID=302980 RepID=UPI000B3D118F|nr:ABC transporter permease [Paenibacillus sp. MY03]OUS73348.1 ABC transporter permease [Paenibacillus sp. MY03]